MSIKDKASWKIYRSVLNLKLYVIVSTVLNDFPSVGDDPDDRSIWALRVESGLYWEAVLNHIYRETFSYFLYSMDEAQRFQLEQLYLRHAQRINAQMSPLGYQDAIDRAALIPLSYYMHSLISREKYRYMM